MRLTERMLNENKKLNKQKAKETNFQLDPEEDDMGMAYMPRPKIGYLNENKGVFDNEDETSINTAKSVFDKTAVFHVEQNRTGGF